MKVGDDGEEEEDMKMDNKVFATHVACGALGFGSGFIAHETLFFGIIFVVLIAVLSYLFAGGE